MTQTIENLFQSALHDVLDESAGLKTRTMTFFLLVVMRRRRRRSEPHRYECARVWFCPVSAWVGPVQEYNLKKT